MPGLGPHFTSQKVKYLCAIKPDSRLSEVHWQPWGRCGACRGRELQVNPLVLSLSRPPPELLRRGESRTPIPSAAQPMPLAASHARGQGKELLNGLESNSSCRNT